MVWRAVMGYEPSASNPLDRRTVVKPLEEEYQHLIQTRILSLTRPEAARYFGPVLITATNFWDMRASDGGPKPRKHPNDLVLPVFASREIGLSGLHSADPAANKNHTDLHALGELGYLELYYGHDGEHVQAAVLYHRADNHFVPLRSPEDFDGRLKWDQARFALIKKWLDEHLPKVKEEPPKGRERAETPADSTEEREGAAQVSGEGVTNTVAPKEPASVPGSASASAERRTKAKALMKEADSLSREGRIQEASDKMDAALGLKPEVAGERTSDWLRSVDGEINPMPVIQLPGLSAAQQRRRFEDAVRAVAGQHGFTWPQFLEKTGSLWVAVCARPRLRPLSTEREPIWSWDVLQAVFEVTPDHRVTLELIPFSYGPSSWATLGPRLSIPLGITRERAEMGKQLQAELSR